jgi:hypothetical protein
VSTEFLKGPKKREDLRAENPEGAGPPAKGRRLVCQHLSVAAEMLPKQPWLLLLGEGRGFLGNH